MHNWMCWAPVIMIQNGNYPTIFKLETKIQKISNDIQFMYYEINKKKQNKIKKMFVKIDKLISKKRDGRYYYLCTG
jgi:hypothetical protein